MPASSGESGSEVVGPDTEPAGASPSPGLALRGFLRGWWMRFGEWARSAGYLCETCEGLGLVNRLDRAARRVRPAICPRCDGEGALPAAAPPATFDYRRR